MSEQKITLNTSAGDLSATLNITPNATHALLLAHGAGADHQHSHMTELAEAFTQLHFATLRFNFPFKQEGRNRVDSKQISINCIAEATDFLKDKCPLPLVVGGHSFGGRMATHAVAEEKLQCCAMILCSYPLHGAGKPATERAAHLKDISPPMLFLSGTRDALAQQTLLTQEVAKLPSIHKIHWLETADHSFKILKRTRTLDLDVYTEAATAAREFVDKSAG